MPRAAVVVAAALVAGVACSVGKPPPRSAPFPTADAVTRLSDAALLRLLAGAGSPHTNVTALQSQLQRLAGEAEPLAAAAAAVATNSKLAHVLTRVWVGRTDAERGPLRLLVGVKGKLVSKRRAQKLHRTLAVEHSLLPSLLAVEREAPAKLMVSEGGECECAILAQLRPLQRLSSLLCRLAPLAAGAGAGEGR